MYPTARSTRHGTRKEAMTNTTISLQLYTVDDALTENLEGSIARLAEIGFDTVEAFNYVDRAAGPKAVFDANGITA
jgi:hypothetical protein